ncbi:MAG: phospho-sugar mutase, partial [Bdellovibrionota bacterium]
MDQQILERANYWATSNAFDMQTKNEIKELIEKKDKTQLTNRFYRNLEFGTGGMRGIMGAGTAMMNIYNIRKASAALSKHLIAEAAKDNEKQQLKIAISFDSRNNGREFAQAAAEVFASFGIKALITKQMRPVPMLSFMVRFFKCNAGVCVTASHNPPAYNGYKVYWSTGGQLVPPHDKKIVSYYNEINDYSSITSIPYKQALNENLVEEIGDELDTAYFKEL